MATRPGTCTSCVRVTHNSSSRPALPHVTLGAPGVGQYSETPILHVGKPRQQAATSQQGSAAAPRAVSLQDLPSGLLLVPGRGLRRSPPTQGPEDPAKVPLVKTLVVLH